MGSSKRAGTKGRPATPRDGSAVELVGLSRATVGWLARLHADGKYPYEGVQKTDENGEPLGVRLHAAQFVCGPSVSFCIFWLRVSKARWYVGGQVCRYSV